MTILADYSQIDPAAWDILSKTSPVKSWFQTREAFLFFDSLGFVDAFVVAVTESDQLKGVVVGYVQGDGNWLKQRLSRRAIIVGGPLLDCDITEVQLSAMLKAMRDQIRGKAIYVETRNLNDYSKWRGVFEGCGFSYQKHLNFHLDTSSKSTIDNNLSRTRKRHIRVGLRDGAVMEPVCNDSEAAEFYQILSDLYRHKVRKPLPPQEFFLKLRRLSSARLLAVKYQGHVIGGMAYVELQGSVGYEWYVCGMDDTYKNLYPSELATYAGLEYAANNGCTRFDFMGAGKPDVPYGVRDFKALFGGMLVEHGRFLLINNPLLFKLGKTVVNLLGKLYRL